MGKDPILIHGKLINNIDDNAKPTENDRIIELSLENHIDRLTIALLHNLIKKDK